MGLVELDGCEELLCSGGEELGPHLGSQSAPSLGEDLLSRDGVHSAGIQLCDAPFDFFFPGCDDLRVAIETGNEALCEFGPFLRRKEKGSSFKSVQG